MAKHKSEGPAVASESDKPDHEVEWCVDDALRTLLKAGEIIKDKKMLTAVKKRATHKAEEHRELAARTERLAKMGSISPKAHDRALAKLNG